MRTGHPPLGCVERLLASVEPWDYSPMCLRLFRLRSFLHRDDRKYKDIGSLIQIIQARSIYLKGGLLGWFVARHTHELCCTMTSSSLGPTACSAASSKVAPPTSFILPDLVSHCPFPLVYHPNGDAVAQQSVDWLDSSCSELSAKQRKALRGLKAGELTAYCYHTTQPDRLRVISDFMNYLFHL